MPDREEAKKEVSKKQEKVKDTKIFPSQKYDIA